MRIRIEARAATSEGNWNREEMAYYDSEVQTASAREEMVSNIAEQNLPHIFLPRDRLALSQLRSRISG